MGLSDQYISEICIDYLRAFVNEDIYRKGEKKFQNKKIVEISPCLLLKTQRVPFSFRGKLLDTSERGQKIILLDGVILRSPKCACFSKILLLWKAVRKSCWESCQENEDHEACINYFTRWMPGSSTSEKKSAIRMISRDGNPSSLCVHKLSEFLVLSHRIVLWPSTKDNFSAFKFPEFGRLDGFRGGSNMTSRKLIPALRPGSNAVL